MDSEVFRLALAGNDLCQVSTVDDVRRIVRWLAPCEYYERCYIKAIYSDGTSEVIPPLWMPSLRRPFVFTWDEEDILPAA
jgi:hypothetical protein